MGKRCDDTFTTVCERHYMDVVAIQLAAEIREAFPALRAEAFSPLVNSDQGQEPLGVAADFGNKEDWTALNSEWLDRSPNGLSSSLTFLSDCAVCFYLPAFLLADLKGELFSAEPSWHLTHGFTDVELGLRIWPRKTVTWTEYSAQRWATLTSRQALAVVHYLEWCAEHRAETDERERQALSNFWYARAG